MHASELFGRPNEGKLILMAGPDLDRMERETSHLEGFVKERSNGGDAEAYRERIDVSGISMILTRIIPAVTGKLDRLALDPYVALAYEADIVLYAAPRALVTVWPRTVGDSVAITHQGEVAIVQHAKEIRAGETMIGFRAHRLG